VAESSLGVGDINEPATALDEAAVTVPGGAIVPLGLREVTYDYDWVCGANGSPLGGDEADLPPISNSTTSLVLPMVVLAGSAINPKSPSFSPVDNPDWAFIGSTIGGQVVSASGPHAFVCGSSPPEISLFAAPPFEIPNPAGPGQISCASPNP
jgi:hypothetical protein